MRKRGREGGREGESEEEREGGRKRGRERRREGGRVREAYIHTCIVIGTHGTCLKVYLKKRERNSSTGKLGLNSTLLR